MAGRLRNQLVDELKASGACQRPEVESALRSVERHRFVPEVDLEEAYADEAILTKVIDGTTVSSISQPTIVARMLDMLAAQPGDSVLEIGTGTGYNAALLCHIVGPAGRVISVEIDSELVSRAERALASAGYPEVRLLRGDGRFGAPEAGPFDRIIVTAAAERVEPAWVGQLLGGGRLVLPLAGEVRAVAFEKVAGTLVEVVATPARFVPLQRGG